MPLRLRDHIHWCLCGGRIVFLDLPGDRYFCLPAGAEAAFLNAVGGNAGPGDTASLASLVSRGFLIETNEQDITPRATLPSASDDYFKEEPAVARAGDVAAAFVREVEAAARLRFGSLAGTVRQVEVRARKALSLAFAGEVRLRRIVSAFTVVSLVLPEADRCLPRAVAVHAACCAAGIRPWLVLGVRLDPFRAHAWLQLEDRVLVGAFEQVRLFTPIAAF